MRRRGAKWPFFSLFSSIAFLFDCILSSSSTSANGVIKKPPPPTCCSLFFALTLIMLANKKNKNKISSGTQMGAPGIAPTLLLGPHRSFDRGAAVGLRIVAAMMSGDLIIDQLSVGKQRPRRSDPIPIRPRMVSALEIEAEVEETEEEDRDDDDDDEAMELSESYTCVISHVGGGKRVYLDDGWEWEAEADGIWGKYGTNSGVFFQSPPPPPLPIIPRCFLCGKKQQGLPIFMYREEKAFCSVECRCQQILREHEEKHCTKAVRKTRDFVHSPYPSSLLFDSGVAAA